MHEVGLAEADTAVQEERVVGVTGAFRDRQARRMGETVGRPDDEVRERVAGVDVARAAFAADAPGLDPDLRRARAPRSPAAVRHDADRLAVRAAARSPAWHVGVAAASPVRVAVAILVAVAVLRRRSDEELDLDAVADQPGQRLGDQRAVAAVEPVLGEAVRNGDAEAVVVDFGEGRLAEPGLEVRGREGHLELTEGGAPDLLRIHGSM